MMDNLTSLPFAFYVRNAASLARRFMTHQGRVYHAKRPHTLASKVRSGDTVASVVYNGIVLREDWVAMVLERTPTPAPQQATKTLRKRYETPARLRKEPPLDTATELYLIRKLLEKLL